jgi:hypothetical protein
VLPAVVVHADKGLSVDETYNLTITREPLLDGAEHEPNDAVATANLLEGATGTMAGFLWPGDADYFRLAVPAGAPVELDLKPPDGVDVKLDVLGPDGKTRMQADAGGPGKPEHLSLNGGGDGGVAIPAGEEALLVRVRARPKDTAFEAPYNLSWSIVPR